ncbi:MAG: tRNA epoxyqueuosine(34) reductase QueG [Planctomycetales bacterium]|nr:tRNA epoxyqueuosine(34) reductase QueG [Planctomycetales bacterium]
MAESSGELTARIKRAAESLGFRRAAVCRASSPERLEQFHTWLDAGYAGEMHYLANRREAYAHPRHVLDEAQSIVMLLFDYDTSPARPPGPQDGQVSRYAWGEQDYHDLVHPLLKQLVAMVSDWAPEASARGVIDTAPLLERDFAQQAGLGWIGKNTLLLDKGAGSLFFLAALLVDVALEYDEPFAADHCGQCTACLDACPTDAFVAPYVLDARRCISYLTIELRGPIPLELRSGVGQWLFGCDVCQDVCPWNRRASADAAPELLARADLNPCELSELFALTEEQFRNRFRRSPLWRPRRRGLLRNAAIVLGNQRDPAALPSLLLGLADDEPLVRGASAWALGEIGGAAAREALQARLPLEPDAEVLTEIRGALEDCQDGCS